jgi:hypothetical protein
LNADGRITVTRCPSEWPQVLCVPGTVRRDQKEQAEYALSARLSLWKERQLASTGRSKSGFAQHATAALKAACHAIQE